jgi:hypothetical protein
LYRKATLGTICAAAYKPEIITLSRYIYWRFINRKRYTASNDKIMDLEGHGRRRGQCWRRWTTTVLATDLAPD